MYKHSCYRDAIKDLNENGYMHDFVLFGNELLWIQGKVFIGCDDFVIVECYQIGHPAVQMKDLVVFAILVISADVRGILLNHYAYTDNAPKIIVDKLKKMMHFSENTSILY